MMKIIYLVICIISTVNAVDIVNPGSKTTNICNDDCNVICTVEYGCHSSIFYIKNNASIIVNCEAKMACNDAVFYYAGTAGATQTCNGDGACYNMIVYAVSVMTLYCDATGNGGNGGYRSCRGLSIVDLISAGNAVTITVDGDAASELRIFSFYHRGPTLNCINGCQLDKLQIYYGLKFDEYCMADETSCRLTQAAIPDDIYAVTTIIDTLSGTYGTDYDFGGYSFGTNVLLVLLDHNDDHSSFIPPILTDPATFLSILCHQCDYVDFVLSSVNNVILTAAQTYATSYGSVVDGPIDSFLLNSYVPLGIYNMDLYLDKNPTTVITINNLGNSELYVGNAIDVNINCAGPSSYRCQNVYVYSTLDPWTSFPGTRWDIDCAGGCHTPIYVNFASGIPPIICQFNNSGYTPECAPFMEATLSPSVNPSAAPTNNPTGITNIPTAVPTIVPTNIPTNIPTSLPTQLPTNNPTVKTNNPTLAPTPAPTSNPSNIPTLDPTPSPTINPTNNAGIQSRDANTFSTTQQIERRSQNNDDGSNDDGIIIGSMISAAVVLFCILLFCWFKYQIKRNVKGRMNINEQNVREQNANCEHEGYDGNKYDGYDEEGIAQYQVPMVMPGTSTTQGGPEYDSSDSESGIGVTTKGNEIVFNIIVNQQIDNNIIKEINAVHATAGDDADVITEINKTTM